MRKHPLPGFEIVSSLLDYNPDTGVFIKKARPITSCKTPAWNARHAGKPVTCTDAYGYVQVGLGYARLKAHRIAWLLAYGSWPPDHLDIDHIDGNRSNNRLSNLRLATRAENLANSKGHSDSRNGIKGVTKTSAGTWEAQIMRRGIHMTLGSFPTADQAKLAYEAAAREHSGDFYRPNAAGA